ncbi:lipoprotein [Caballeronia ptereochthonis]|uniref:Lipoprotein n=2 Tax=Caballeronia ptereochthonis TaxID=1777144 RepID=A0A158DYC3_9BURK|nr:lipoprotein [Caballeronia ptereochthonis]
MKRIAVLASLLIAAGVTSACAVYVPDSPAVAVKPQGGVGNGFCPPGQGKKGNC